MNSSKILKRKLLIASLTGLVLIIAFIVFNFILKNYLIQRDSASLTLAIAPPKKEARPKEVTPGLPVRLKIPKINVDAAIESAGVTPKGEMDTPKNPTNTGWYNLGPRPGEIGSSVIDGHFGWKNGIPAVFDDLHTLQKGDTIHVNDEKGANFTFVVRELRAYGPNDDATDVFRSNDAKSHLNLITCKGTWNADQQSYSTRLVVFADKEIG